MADKKISALTTATLPLTGAEVLPVVQSGATVKVANNDLRPKQIQSNATTGVLQVAGPSAGATRVMTTPDADFTAARIDNGQTFTGTQKFSGLPQAEYTDATVWSTTAHNADRFRTTNLSSTNNSFAASGYQVNYGDGSSAAVVTGAIASASFSADYAIVQRNAGNYIETFRIKYSGDVQVNTGNLILSTSGKGITLKSPNGLITKTLTIDNAGLIALI